jgi:tripartite-type tricarboxylate transporter receptor subunit TctC
VLGVASAERSALYPQAPTLREQGFPNVAAAGWYVRAAKHDRRWGATVKAIAGGLLRRLRHGPGSPTG